METPSEAVLFVKLRTGFILRFIFYFHFHFTINWVLVSACVCMCADVNKEFQARKKMCTTTALQFLYFPFNVLFALAKRSMRLIDNGAKQFSVLFFFHITKTCDRSTPPTCSL